MLVRNSGVHINITVTIAEPSLQAATPQEERRCRQSRHQHAPPPPPPSIRGRSDAQLANESRRWATAADGPRARKLRARRPGSWAVSRRRRVAQRCATCERCRYVSFLAAGRLDNHSRSTAHPRSGRAPFYWQCRWYSRCDLADLRRAPSPLEYRTVRVSAARVPTSSARDGSAGGAPLRLAIATLFELKGGVNPDWECCFVQWCENAARLAALLPASWTSDQLVLSSDVSMADRLAASSGCTRLRVVVVSEELRAAAAPSRRGTLASTTGARDEAGLFNPAKFHKWQVVAAAAYDVVIFADADLELVPVADTVPALAREAWRHVLALHASHIELVCNPDPRSPLNGGLMLLKPSAAVYAEGVRAADRTLRPGRRLGRRRSRRRGGASVPRRACGRARAVRLPAPQGAPPRLAASSLRRTAAGAPTVLGHLRARGPATRGSCSTCTLRDGCAGRTAASRTNRPTCACLTRGIGGLASSRGSSSESGCSTRAAASGGSDGTRRRTTARTRCTSRNSTTTSCASTPSRATRHRRRPRAAAVRRPPAAPPPRDRGVQPVPQIYADWETHQWAGGYALAGASRHPESYIL